MQPTRTAFGAWSGGRFMHFGAVLDEDAWIALTRNAYELGIRTFITADVYGAGEADSLLGRALQGFPRDSYCLVGAIGHDFYSGKRDGAKGFPRFTDPRLRLPVDYAGYVKMAVEKSLERCRAQRFDLLLLHNPDSIGYSQENVWKALDRVREEKLTDLIGVAPGPANGFTLDMLQCFERFGDWMDWAMIILNPFEPWPGSLILPAAKHHDVKLITRVVDFGGIFHDDVQPGHVFGAADHRSFRPPGWVEEGCEKLQRLRPFARQHGLTPLQLSCLWNLSQAPVASVVPTLIEEVHSSKKPILEKVRELAGLPERTLSADEIEEIRRIGDNTGCMALKGANREHTTVPEPDRWSLTPDHERLGRRWSIDPDRDLAYRHGNG